MTEMTPPCSIFIHISVPHKFIERESVGAELICRKRNQKNNENLTKQSQSREREREEREFKGGIASYVGNQQAQQFSLLSICRYRYA